MACFFKISSRDPGMHFAFTLLESERGGFAIFSTLFLFNEKQKNL